FSIKGTNPHPPASVLVPAQSLHHTAFYGYNRGSQAAHQVIAQMFSGKAIGAAVSEIRAVAVPIAGSNGRKGFQTIGLLPLPIVQNPIVPHKAAQNRCVSLVIIIIILIQRSQQLLRSFPCPQIPYRLFYGIQPTLTSCAATR